MQEKYFQQLKEFIAKYIDTREARAFVFGSSLRSKHFYDIDVGVTGKVEEKKLNRLRNHLAESTFPYKVDVVNFEKTEKSFQKQVLQGSIKWLN